MVLTVVCFAVALLSLTVILRVKHIRDEREMEQHSITAEELHSLLASNQDVLILDVRQPLDLLAYPEIIPGAHWIPPKEASGSREYFGALLLGAYKNGKLQYVGKVGTGFTRDVLASLYRKFQPLKRKQPPVEDLARIQEGATFLSPKLVAQISYTEWTKDGKLRHPVFLGLRDDKDPKDVVLPGAQ